MINICWLYVSDKCVEVVWINYYSLLCIGFFLCCKNIDVLVSFKEFINGIFYNLCFGFRLIINIVCRRFIRSFLLYCLCSVVMFLVLMKLVESGCLL